MGTAPLQVLDLCCSYGVNAALMRCGVRMDELYDHHSSPALADLSAAELAKEDDAYYAERCRPESPRAFWLDVTSNTVERPSRSAGPRSDS